jgi:hypothetical protein
MNTLTKSKACAVHLDLAELRRLFINSLVDETTAQPICQRLFVVNLYLENLDQYGK